MKEKPELSPEKESYLEQVFNQDLEILSNCLDLKLSCQNFKESVKNRSQYHF